MGENRRGVMYQKRVHDVNRIFDEESAKGLSNREIWRRFIYPKYGMTERTFYNLLGAAYDPKAAIPEETLSLFPELDGDD